VKADAPKLHFGLLNPMLSLTARGDAVGRALVPAMVGLVIALGDPGVEALQAIAIAFSAIVDPPTDDKALCRLEAWVAPIFRDSQPHSMFHPFFESLFRALWPVLDGLWESDRPLVQQSLSSLVEAVFPWVFCQQKTCGSGLCEPWKSVRCQTMRLLSGTVSLTCLNSRTKMSGCTCMECRVLGLPFLTNHSAFWRCEKS
jgi:hypothetical protein